MAISKDDLEDCFWRVDEDTIIRTERDYFKDG